MWGKSTKMNKYFGWFDNSEMHQYLQGIGLYGNTYRREGKKEV